MTLAICDYCGVVILSAQLKEYIDGRVYHAGCAKNPNGTTVTRAGECTCNNDSAKWHFPGCPKLV
jgi:hypothetical protein